MSQDEFMVVVLKIAPLTDDELVRRAWRAPCAQKRLVFGDAV